MLRNPDEAETLPMDLAFDVLDEQDMILIWQWKTQIIFGKPLYKLNHLQSDQLDQTQDEVRIPSGFPSWRLVFQ